MPRYGKFQYNQICVQNCPFTFNYKGKCVQDCSHFLINKTYYKHCHNGLLGYHETCHLQCPMSISGYISIQIKVCEGMSKSPFTWFNNLYMSWHISKRAIHLSTEGYWNISITHTIWFYNKNALDPGIMLQIFFRLFGQSEVLSAMSKSNICVYGILHFKKEASFIDIKKFFLLSSHISRWQFQLHERKSWI